MNALFIKTIRCAIRPAVVATLAALCLAGCGKRTPSGIVLPPVDKNGEAIQPVYNDYTETFEMPTKNQQPPQSVVSKGSYTSDDNESRSQPYDQGFEQGYQDGYDDGLDNARENTYDPNCPYSDYRCDDFEEGYHDGYEEGFHDGYAETGGNPDMEE